MPARRKILPILPHAVAVGLAPDSADKRAVLDLAEAHYLRHGGDLIERQINFAVLLHDKAVARMSEDIPPDDFDRMMGHCIRMNAQVTRLVVARDKAKERSYMFARITHYRKAGTLVGDIHDPVLVKARGEEEALQLQDTPQVEPKPEAAMPGVATPEVAPAPQQAAPRPAAAVTHRASNRQIKEYVHMLKRRSVKAEIREEFRKRAVAEGWDKIRLAAEAHKILAA